LLERSAALEELNERLQTDIALRREAEAQFRRAHQRKDEFLAMLGHELRNPLGPIRNCGELLRIMSSKNPDLKDIPDIILRQAGHLARIVDDLLDLGRIASGKFLLRTETLDLGSLVKAIVSDVTPQVTAQEIELNVSLPEEPLWLVADPTRLSQAIGNLIQNATKFTDRHGHVFVRIELDCDRHEAVIAVQDDGIGIDREMLPRLFEPFTQAERSLDRSRGGLGLGLALVKGLIELHAGQIEAKSSRVWVPGRNSSSACRWKPCRSAAH
jgi:signal transduction histidine kinase